MLIQLKHHMHKKKSLFDLWVQDISYVILDKVILVLKLIFSRDFSFPEHNRSNVLNTGFSALNSLVHRHSKDPHLPTQLESRKRKTWRCRKISVFKDTGTFWGQKLEYFFCHECSAWWDCGCLLVLGSSVLCAWMGAEEDNEPLPCHTHTVKMPALKTWKSSSPL